jgi:hypothetical protein
MTWKHEARARPLLQGDAAAFLLVGSRIIGEGN